MNDQFIQGVIFDWNRIDNDSYLKEIEAFNGVEKLDFNKSITFFVGENGSGKSTLLEAIAIAHGFNPEGGTKNYVFSTHDTHSELCDAIKMCIRDSKEGVCLGKRYEILGRIGSGGMADVYKGKDRKLNRYVARCV